MIVFLRFKGQYSSEVHCAKLNYFNCFSPQVKVWEEKKQKKPGRSRKGTEA